MKHGIHLHHSQDDFIIRLDSLFEDHMHAFGDFVLGVIRDAIREGVADIKKHLC